MLKRYYLGAEQPFATTPGIGVAVLYGHRRKFTLMPLIALGGLSLALTIPILSASTIHAAAPVHYATVVVQPGDNVWSLAEQRAGKGTDIQSVVDEIVAVNHLGEGSLTPGQRIRLPQ